MLPAPSADNGANEEAFSSKWMSGSPLKLGRAGLEESRGTARRHLSGSPATQQLPRSRPRRARASERRLSFPIMAAFIIN